MSKYNRYLPGRKIPGTTLRELPCGCIVTFWRITGLEVIRYCEKHERESNELGPKVWAQKSFLEKTIKTITAGIVLLTLIAGVGYALFFVIAIIYEIIRYAFSGSS
ncbi:MAG TPA: hypothetical protein VF596_16295 [Pyrinomonadaceae bacterium]|jgi:hypothetical protein